MAKSSKNLADAIAAPNISGEQAALPTGVVKSAGRVLQIFELFDLLQTNKKWWLAPMILAHALIGFLIVRTLVEHAALVAGYAWARR